MTIAGMWLEQHGNKVDPPTIRSAADAAQLFGRDFAARQREMLYVVHLDAAGRLIALARQHGAHDRLPLIMADLVRDVCRLASRRLLIAHNHPSGDPRPSAADRLATRRLAEMMRLLDIELVDHLVFAQNGVASFRAMGLL